MMAVPERPGAATFLGNPLTLLGQALTPGDRAPAFTLVGPGLAEVSLNDSAGKVRLLSCVPSLDTPVCSTETQRWEQERAGIGDAVLLTVSMDLPFAQQRWCATKGVQHTTVSAHKNEQFGIDYGVLIYAEYVREISHEPDYAKALEALRQAAAS